MSSYDDTANFGLQGSQRKQYQGKTLGNSDEGKKKSATRTRVIIGSYRVRLLDRDNLYGGAKALCDSLTYAGLILSDSEKDIEYEVVQIRVAHRKDEKTVVMIEYP